MDRFGQIESLASGDMLIVEPSNDQIQVSAAPHPFKTDRVDFLVKEGSTLLEIVNACQPDPMLARFGHVFIDDHFVPRNLWHVVRPKPGRKVTLRVVPQGSGGGGKSILRIILTLVVVVASVFLPPLLGITGTILGVSAAALASAAIGAVGMLLVNAIAPVRPPSLGLGNASGPDESQALFIEGARNQARPWSVVPTVVGQHRMVPNYGGQPITEQIGQDQYLRMLFVWGYGPLTISDLKIGETPIEEFEGVQIETRDGLATDDPLTLYPDTVVQNEISVVLEQADSWQQLTTDPDADEISIDFGFPQGLVKFEDDGTKTDAGVAIVIRFRKVGDLSWIGPNFSQTTVGSKDTISAIANLTSVQVVGATGTFRRYGLRWPTPERAQYEVQVRRSTADRDDDSIFDQVVWLSLRTITDEDPIQFDKPVAKTAVVIKATDQLNRIVDELNGVPYSRVPDWDTATQTWITRETSNPASHYRNVLQGPAIAVPQPNSRIDLLKLQAWHEFCDAQGFRVDQVRDYGSSVWETLADIASAGRASPAQFDGKWSVVIDQEQAAPVQHFTPRNTWGFNAEKAFPDLPHAWRLRFNNRDEGWRQDERIVYDDGFSSVNATQFEQLELLGVTGADQVWKLGRYHIAAARLRPERWNFNADFEHLVARRGDLVLLTHDVLLVGLAAGRIKSLTTDGAGDVEGITVDEVLTMEAATNYGVSIRTVSDTKVTSQVITNPGDQNTVTFPVPIPAESGIAAGDLFGFGVLGSETIEALVYALERSDNLTARVVTIPYSPDIYDAAAGDIPAFQTGVTPLEVVPAPTIASIVSDESALERGAGETLLVRAIITAVPIDFENPVLEVQLRPTNTGELWSNADIVRRNDASVTIGGVRQRETYDFRVRWRVEERGFGSPWTLQSNVTIVGKGTPPNPLVNMTGSVFGGQIFIRWDQPDELDVKFGGSVYFRHSMSFASPRWSESVSIGDTARARSLIAHLPLKPGTYLARVFDADGNPGGVTTLSTKQASVLAFADVDSLDEHPSFAGTHDGTSGFTTLKLSGLGLVDDIPDFDEVGDLDSFGGVQTSGTYTFASGFDLSTVKKVRLTVRIDGFSQNVLDNLDERTELMDSWEDFDGTEQAQADAQVWVRQTDDDPTGTPVWSTYERLDSAEFEARAFSFQARLMTDDPTYNFIVEELGVDVEEVV